jgi:TRIAD3 protein (E3 ubiquitin-protein ligase RNF216)
MSYSDIVLYFIVIDDPNERVFRCLNQECLKETCRTCGESNHIPLRCDEVEKKDELDMRTFIENRVTEAMIRVCYKCKQRFYKLEGCNKMTCACGASMCYVCRQPIKGYDHFNNNEKCGANTDVVTMHQEEMRLAYDEAKNAYIERHPEAQDLVLKYDPQQHLAGNKTK